MLKFKLSQKHKTAQVKQYLTPLVFTEISL